MPISLQQARQVFDFEQSRWLGASVRSLPIGSASFDRRRVDSLSCLAIFDFNSSMLSALGVVCRHRLAACFAWSDDQLRWPSLPDGS